MPYWSGNSKEKAKGELLAALSKVLPEEKAQETLQALENFVNAYIDYATDDLYDRVNKRGAYDPDY